MDSVVDSDIANPAELATIYFRRLVIAERVSPINDQHVRGSHGLYPEYSRSTPVFRHNNESASGPINRKSMIDYFANPGCSGIVEVRCLRNSK